MPVYLIEYLYLLPHTFFAAALFLMTAKKRLFLEWGALWFTIWSIAYLLKNIYLIAFFILWVGMLIWPKTKGERIAYYFLLLPVFPLFVSKELPGLIPGIRAWFPLNVPVMLCLFVLFPLAAKTFFFSNAKDGLFVFKTDKYVASYLVLLSLLSFRNPTLTSGLREMSMHFLGVFLPYYAISRSLKKREDFEIMFYAIAFSGMIVASVGIMEAVKRWPMFLQLIDIMNLPEAPISPFLLRGGLLRIGSTFASGTPVGYFLTAVIAILFFLKKFSKLNKQLLYLIAGMSIFSIFFTASRGAWLGFLVMAVVTAIYQKGKKMKVILFFLLTAYIIFPFLKWTPVGHAITYKFEQVVPNSTEHSEYVTIDYRTRLIQAALTTMALNPWFGSKDYLDVEEMQAMKQGEGIVDVVNTYLGVGLAYGWVGVALFAMIFVSTIWNLFILANNRKLRKQSEYFSQMAVVFLAIFITTVVVIGTVSSVSLLPHYYWAFTGVAAAFIRVANDIKKDGAGLKEI